VRTRATPLAAFVLHHYDWSESSLVLDLFTREEGRLVVVAKGAKRPSSQLRAVLLPLQRLNLTLTRPPAPAPTAAPVLADEATAPAGEVRTLRAAEFGGGAPMPGGAAIFSGYYLNELLIKLLARNDPHPALFDAYAATLPLLAGGTDAVVQAALRAFELVLLREVGLLPELTRDAATQRALQPDGRYALRPEFGLVRVGSEEPGVVAELWPPLQQALDRRDLKALALACATDPMALRTQLRPWLHYHLGTPTLRTRTVMQDLQRLLE
jgi:DNA repair protein RecO (recombination protein O)